MSRRQLEIRYIQPNYFPTQKWSIQIGGNGDIHLTINILYRKNENTQCQKKKLNETWGSSGCVVEENVELLIGWCVQARGPRLPFGDRPGHNPVPTPQPQPHFTSFSHSRPGAASFPSAAGKDLINSRGNSTYLLDAFCVWGTVLSKHFVHLTLDSNTVWLASFTDGETPRGSDFVQRSYSSQVAS